jgi:predicted dehydrogenase
LADGKLGAASFFEITLAESSKMTVSDQCRWGILSTAGIAKKNWRAIAKSANGTVAAVASRRIESAQAFISECQFSCPQLKVPQALGSYESLLASQDIDAVYIPLPTGIRKEWIIAAANQGKHVLAEKPTALSAHDLEEILAACDRNHVQFMDGVMFMHSARLPRLRQVLDDGSSIGEIKRIACHFSFLGGDEFSRNNIRVDSTLEPFGCLGDLGWYCIRFLLWANQWQMPTEVTGKCIQSLRGAKSEGSVPADFSAELAFPNGSTASFYCSFVSGHQQWAHISGTKGNAFVRDFVLPTFGNEVSFDVEQPHFAINGCDFHMQEHTQRISVAEYASGYAPAQEINMIEALNQIVLNKKLDPHWGQISLATQRVLDELYRQC